MGTEKEQDYPAIEFGMRTTSMSLFYPMKKFAAYIPALARVEEFCYLRWQNKKEATSAFLDHMGFSEEDKELLLWVYDCDERFYDWNFPNLQIYAKPDEWKRIFDEAEKFLKVGKYTDY